MIYLGIDIGGSGVKCALVDVTLGTLSSERHRIAASEENTPGEIILLTQKILQKFNYSGSVGIGFPAPIKNGVIKMAANIHPDWVGMNAAEAFSSALDCPCYVINDADAAGIAEIRFGVGNDLQNGVVLLITLGTGIGSALFINGELLPNTEFGHLKIRGKDAETRASDAARKSKKLTWEKWTSHLQEFLQMMETLISPDLILIGGGVSKKSEKFLPYLKLNTEIRPASLLNEAGIIGSAIFAADQMLNSSP